jgi:hypothetical protein
MIARLLPTTSTAARTIDRGVFIAASLRGQPDNSRQGSLFLRARLFHWNATWRRSVAGSLPRRDVAAGSGDEVVPASNYRALQNQVRELHRLLGKKTLEAEILKEALEHATGPKKQLRLPPLPPKDGSR